MSIQFSGSIVSFFVDKDLLRRYSPTLNDYSIVLVSFLPFKSLANAKSRMTRGIVRSSFFGFEATAFDV